MIPESKVANTITSVAAASSTQQDKSQVAPSAQQSQSTTSANAVSSGPQLALPEPKRKSVNLSQIGRSASSFQTVPQASSHLHAVSSCNISMNTTMQRHMIEEEDNLHWTSDDEEGHRANAANQVDHIDACFNKRFFKYNDCISKSKYRTIHRGYDNDSGCEIAWTTYRLHNDKRERLSKALDHFKQLGQSQGAQNRNILRVFYNEVRTVQPGQASALPAQRQGLAPKSRTVETTSLSARDTSLAAAPPQEELIVVSELITGGSIRE